MRLRTNLALLLAALLAGCGSKSSDGAGGHGGAGAAGSGGTGGTGGAGTGAGGIAGTGGSAGTGGAVSAGNAGSSGTAGGAGTGTAGVTGAAGGAGAGTGGVAGTGTGSGGVAGTGGIAGTPDAGSPDAGACTPSERPALRGAPDILILLDASGSMNDDVTGQACSSGCGATSKWAQLIPAINQIVSQTEATVNWGLKFFADLDNRCGVATSVAVPIAPHNAAAVADAIVGRTSANGGVLNGGQTPTRVAETVAADVLSTVTDSNPKFILLATDGQPNCVTSTNVNSDDSPAAIAAVGTAAARGFATFVVGIAIPGLGIADTTLSSMAVAGGRPRDGTPQYYPVSSTDEFLAALQGVVVQAGTCTLGIGPPPPGGSLDAITVRSDGTAIAHDPARVSGWDYADPGHTSIALFGPACTALRNGTVQAITIAFACPPAG